MCEQCVIDGKLSKETYERIEAFLDEWPNARFGPAHTELDDLNLMDGNLEQALALTHAAISHEANNLPAWARGDFMDRVGWYEDHPREELEATLVFLTDLLLIPEVER